MEVDERVQSSAPLRLHGDASGGAAFQHDLTLLALLLERDHDAFATALRKEPERLDRFARFVAAQGLQLFVHAELARSPVRASLPRPWLDRLKAAYFTQWAAQERLVQGLKELASALEGRHEFILLKGPYHAMRFFGGINRREFADLDILIRRRDLGSVERVLADCGYARKSKVVLNRALTARFTHALDFAKPGSAVDLHWSLSANAAHALDYEAIWRRRQPFVLGEQRFFVLSDEYELVFSLISIFKDLERGAARVKAFVDLYFMLLTLSDTVDWQTFLDDRRGERLRRVCVGVLAILLEMFECAERFPQVAAVVAGDRTRTTRTSPAPADLLTAAEGALRNKLWAADFYECSRLQLFSWWLVSLPFRLAVHAPGRYGMSRHLEIS